MSSFDDFALIGAQELRELITPTRAQELIREALTSGFDPSADPARMNTDLGAGHLLLMPSQLGEWVGMKLASVAPDNAEHGLPRIQALYVLLDAQTLTPQVIMDGTALTELRTPAVSAVAADFLASPDASRMVVFGAGPQAMGHVRALSQVREMADIALIGRSLANAEAAVRLLAAEGFPIRLGQEADVGAADIIACATSSSRPLFEGSVIKAGACVVAVGSHEADRRELGADLLGRSLVVVEDQAAAMREAGDVVMSVSEGALTVDSLKTLAALVRGEFIRVHDRPNVFKGTGMSWQDLAVAAGVAADGTKRKAL